MATRAYKLGRETVSSPPAKSLLVLGALVEPLVVVVVVVLGLVSPAEELVLVESPWPRANRAKDCKSCVCVVLVNKSLFPFESKTISLQSIYNCNSFEGYLHSRYQIL